MGVSSRVRFLAVLGAVVLAGLLLYGLDVFPWARLFGGDGTEPADPGSLTAAQDADAVGLEGRAEGEDETAITSASASLPEPIDLDAVDRVRDLHGVVVRTDGAPIAGASVRASGLPWRRGSTLAHELWDVESPGPETTSARDGSFALRLRRATEVSLRVEADGFATTTLGQRQPGERVRVVLQRPVVLEIVTKDPDGALLSGVVVELHGSDASSGTGFRGRGVSDAEGLCRFEGLPGGGRVRIEARHGPLGGWDDRWERIELPAEGTLRHETLIKPGRIVRGVVTDAATQRPVANARVGMGWTMFKEARTDAEGRYALGGWTGQGYHELHVLAAGYGRAGRQIGDADVIDIALERGFALHGCVLGPGGRPGGGAQVAAVGSHLVEHVQSISTGAVLAGPDGCFVIPDLRRDLPHTLVVMAVGLGRHVRRVDPPPEGALVHDVGDIHLEAERRVSGRVLDADGKPITRMSVTVTGPLVESDDDDGSYGREEERVTDDLGRFAFGELSPGDYVVTAGAHNAERVTRPIELTAAEDVDGLELRFERRRKLSVRLVDERGKPVSEATVFAQPWGAEDTYAFTGKDGAVVFNLPMHVRWLDVHVFGVEGEAAYLQPDSERVAADAGEHRIVLADAAVVAGRLLGPDGTPIRMAVVLARRGDEDVGSAMTDMQGSFRLELPPGGPVDVRYVGDVWRDQATTGHRMHRRLALECVRRATPVPSAGITLRAAAIPAEARLDVRVRLPGGGAAKGFIVVIEPAADGVDGQATTDAEGRVRFDGLTVHPVTVTARPPAAQTSELASLQRENVKPGGQTLELQLATPLMLEGRVVDATGAPLAGASITCNRVLGGVMPTTKSDEDGRFRLALPPEFKGRVEIWASTKGPKGVFLHATVSGIDPREGPLRLELKPHRGW